MIKLKYLHCNKKRATGLSIARFNRLAFSTTTKYKKAATVRQVLGLSDRYGIIVSGNQTKRKAVQHTVYNHTKHLKTSIPDGDL